MVTHVILQITFQWVSVTGLIAAGLALVTITLGAILFKSKKRTPGMLWAHRGAVMALTMAIITHLISKR
ncbi:hypothetical protein SDC9_153776 [bioreactor metagenome]|uniref:Uncharacterized protein n=1 Tax=bioreactor metagenome TaxID=1076179 RepID=A0A645EYH2_9ZZZZ